MSFRVSYQIRSCLLALSALTSLGIGSSPLQASEIAGDCRNFSFYERFGDTLADPTGLTTKVLRGDVPVYSDADSTTSVRKEKFSESVNVVQVLSLEEHPSERVGVIFPFDAVDAGKIYWMERSDLLCRMTPMIDRSSGLERKALIRTKTTEREEGVIQAITTYGSPNLSAQSATGRELSRFRTYLIYAESENAFLLGDKFSMANMEDRLVGWVDKKSVLNWNWSIGLRPPITPPSGTEGAGSICGYENPNETTNCVPILGGNSWFKTDRRLPILEVTDTHYRVAAAASGLGGAETTQDGKIKLTKSMLDKLQISPEEVRGADIDNIQSFNQIDLFFLIDGTKSMGPFIDAIRGTGNGDGVVHEIVRAIEERGGGASIRAGFRVFRDSKDGSDDNGIHESFQLSDDDCSNDSAFLRKKTRARFDHALQRIQVSSEIKDDYPENLLGALMHSSQDMGGCPNRQKMLFVISDAGYDADKQASRGHEWYNESDASSELTELEKLTVFFIRPPERDRAGFRSDKSFNKYLDSWYQFETLADNITQQVLERDIRNGNGQSNQQPSSEEYFLQLGGGGNATSQMINKIVASVKQIARPDIVNDILIDLRGGAALEKVITRLQRENEDVPVLYWNMLRRTTCDEDEQACKERIFDGVFDLYIRRDQPHVLEAWLRGDELLRWNSLLKPIIDATGNYNVKEQRAAMELTMRNSLESILNMPTVENMNEDLATFMRRAGLLPGPIKSPMLNYSFAELRDPSKVPACELDRLKVWLIASGKMLQNAHAQNLSDYSVETPRDCPMMSPKGQKLRYIREAPQTVAPGPNRSDYLLGRTYLGETMYWVPHEYLP